MPKRFNGQRQNSGIGDEPFEYLRQNTADNIPQSKIRLYPRWVRHGGILVDVVQ